MANTQNSAQDKATETAKTNLDRTAAQGTQLVEAAQNGVDKLSELREQTAESTRQIVQNTFEVASQQAREVSERFTRNFGFGGEDSQRFADQSKQNLEAITRSGTVLGQAFQDVSRSWIELSQKQWQRNLDGFSRLARSRSTQEFAAIQSEIARESLQSFLEDGRGIAEKSLRATEEAGKTFANISAR